MSMSRIGQGPFQVVDFWPPDHVKYAGDGTRPEGDLNRCACCGANITWRVVIHNAADDKTYIVGRTCALRAQEFFGCTDDQLKADLRRREKAARQAQEEAAWQAKEAKRRQMELVELRAQELRSLERELHAWRPEAFPWTEWDRALTTAHSAARFELRECAPLYLELGSMGRIYFAVDTDNLIVE